MNEDPLDEEKILDAIAEALMSEQDAKAEAIAALLGSNSAVTQRVRARRALDDALRAASTDHLRCYMLQLVLEELDTHINDGVSDDEDEGACECGRQAHECKTAGDPDADHGDRR